MHADRTNRILLLLLALLLIIAGAAAGAASIGAFGTATRHSPLIANPTGHFIGTQGGWLWPAAAVAAVILALLALRWLLALLFSTDRAGDLPITPGGSAGRTTLAARALTEAVAEEVESYRGVNSARARLLGDPADPELVVTAALEETADFAALRQRIETRALTHARSAVGNPSLPTQLDLTVTTKRSTRVASGTLRQSRKAYLKSQLGGFGARAVPWVGTLRDHIAICRPHRSAGSPAVPARPGRAVGPGWLVRAAARAQAAAAPDRCR